MTTCQICGGRMANSLCTNSLCRAYGKSLGTPTASRDSVKSVVPKSQPADLEAKLMRQAKNARHEALFPLALLLLNLLVLRGVGLPLGGLAVAIWSLYRASRAGRLIRQNRIGEGLLPKLEVTIAIAQLSVALSLLALVLNLWFGGGGTAAFPDFRSW